MKITDIRLTPMFCRFKEPYVWAQGVNEGAEIVLIEIDTDKGVVGIGESTTSPRAEPVLSILRDACGRFVGQSAYDGQRLIGDFYRAAFNSQGTGSAPRYFAQAMTGVEMAVWDAIGKQSGLPLHKLLGGAVRDKVEYFGFVQGDTPKELAHHAKALVRQGFKVIYLKVGRGEIDHAIVREVRRAVGSARLRLDANEAWDMLTARRMFEAFAPYDIEFIEQPMPSSHGLLALADLRARTTIPIAADQAVFSPEEVYAACSLRACDVITLGMHETGGILRYRKAAAIAEAAGLKICIHGVFETGITTCASNQVAAAISNMDDGNQIMWQLLAEDVVKSPDLTPMDGALPVSQMPGLGFELDRAAVKRAAAAYRRRRN
jgi:muconate cycloisomerase